MRAWRNSIEVRAEREARREARRWSAGKPRRRKVTPLLAKLIRCELRAGEKHEYLACAYNLSRKTIRLIGRGDIHPEART